MIPLIIIILSISLICFIAYLVGLKERRCPVNPKFLGQHKYEIIDICTNTFDDKLTITYICNHCKRIKTLIIIDRDNILKSLHKIFKIKRHNLIAIYDIIFTGNANNIIMDEFDEIIDHIED